MEIPYLVSVLCFDFQTEQRLRQKMQCIRQLVGLPCPSDMAPHISLVPSGLGDRQDVVERLSGLLAHQTPLDVTLSHVGYFSGGVIFLGATPTEELISLHRRVFKVSQPKLDVPWSDLYSPGQWVPHCTLLLRIPDDCLSLALKEAREAVSPPLQAQCVAVEILEAGQGRVQTLKRINLKPREV